MNKVTLFGRLVADPELRYTQTGVPVTNFTLAVRRNYKNKDGQYDSDFLDCVVWRRPAEVLAESLSRGSRILVSGRIETSSYEDSNGVRRRKWTIIVEDWSFVDPRNGNGSTNGSVAQDSQNEPEYGDVYNDVPF